MPHQLHELPQKQALLPCFLFQIPAMTIARSSAATTAATIMVGQFINTLLSVTYPTLVLGVFTFSTASLYLFLRSSRNSMQAKRIMATAVQT